jgi:hypothetical protein
MQRARKENQRRRMPKQLNDKRCNTDLTTAMTQTIDRAGNGNSHAEVVRRNRQAGSHGLLRTGDVGICRMAYSVEDTTITPMELNLLSPWNQMSLLAAENLLRRACYSGVWLKTLLSRSVLVVPSLWILS